MQLAVTDPALSRAAVVDRTNRVYLSVPDATQTVGALVDGYDPSQLRLTVALQDGRRIVLWFDEGQLYARLYESLVLIGVALLSALVATLLFAPFAARWVGQPLAELAALARSIPESGDFQVEAVSGGSDEVGQLRGAFGEMLSKVERREHALEEAREAAELAANDARQMAAQAQATADALESETQAREKCPTPA